MNNNKIKVGHLVREFVRPTESFIINQLKFLSENGNFEPIVISKVIRNQDHFPNVEVKGIGNTLTGISKKLDDIYYRYLR